MSIGIKKSCVVVGALGIALALSVAIAKAAVITQWSFNSNSATANANPNSPLPTTGSGTAITLGMNNSYNAPGSVAGDDFPSTAGTGDPNFSEYLWRVRGNGTLPNGLTSTNGWALYNITSGTAHDGAPQYSQGIELDTSTVGYSSVSFSFDWYSTTQGVRDLQFQYNLNTSNSAGWTNLTNPSWVTLGAAGVVDQQSSPGHYTGNYVFAATPNDFYYGTTNGQQLSGVGNPLLPITVNLSSVAGASNDPNLGIRLVSAFDDSGQFQDYVSASYNAGVSQKYNNSSGNWRLGNLTFSGNLSVNTSFSGPALTWNSASGNWDTASSNKPWLDSGNNSAAYADGSVVTFGNVSSGTSTITVASGGVSPGGVTVNNSNSNGGYAFTGGAISGSGALYLASGNAGFVSLSGTNTYTGSTQVSGGTLIVAGDASLGAVNGAAGSVVLDNGSTLLLASNLSSGRIFETGPNGGVLNTNGNSFSTSGNFLGGGALHEARRRQHDAERPLRPASRAP